MTFTTNGPMSVVQLQDLVWDDVRINPGGNYNVVDGKYTVSTKGDENVVKVT